MNAHQLIISLLFIGLLNSGYTQITGFGVQTNLNISRHHYNNPEKPKDGVTATQNLYSFGTAFYANYEIKPVRVIRTKIGFESKGFTNKYQYLSNSGSVEVVDKYKFDYVSADILYNYYVLHLDPIIKIYPMAGVSFGYLYKQSMPENAIYNNPYHGILPNNNFDSYSKFNLSAILGIGIDIKDIIWAEVALNKDLISPIKGNNLAVRNRVVEFNIGLNVLQLIKNSKS